MAPASRSGPRSSAAPTPAPQEPEEYGLQVRSMGLKVHYTFDRESQVHCLARWPYNLQVQAIPLDEQNSIGVVDLRTCLMAVAQCSPEIVSQQDNDYTVYAYDYSEPDVPLVGQGMLSWGLDPNSNPQSQQLLTGRVTRSLLAIFGNGLRETLEVKLRLTAVPKMLRADHSGGLGPQQQQSQQQQQQQPPMRLAPTPVDNTNAEWSSFLQSNPTLGRSASVAALASPSLGPTRPGPYGSRSPEIRSDGPLPQSNRPPSIAPAPPKNLAPSSQQQQQQQQQSADTGSEKPSRPSRPSSRASRKAPTGRPRGRPRKKPQEAGSTSAAEEATDADDGPQRKRAKVVKADHSSTAPFGSAPDSLRVAASTSGSLRNMRPVAAPGDHHHHLQQQGSHLHDGPRAPTPVPEAQSLNKQQQRRRGRAIAPRRTSMAEFDGAGAGAYQSHLGPPAMQFGMPQQDARSPTDSFVQSPDQGYAPEESPADLGSSPPVPRGNAFMHSSPMPSSPILPPMPMPMGPVDSGFMSGSMDDLFEDEDFAQDLPCRDDQSSLFPGLALDQSSTAPPQQTTPEQGQEQGQVRGQDQCQDQGQGQGKRQSQLQTQSQPPPPPQPLAFHEVHPGPPEFLPTTSIFNPAGRAKSLNKAAAQKKPAPRTLKRANTAPQPPRADPEPVFQPTNHNPSPPPPPPPPPPPSLPTPDTYQTPNAAPEMLDHQQDSHTPSEMPQLPQQPPANEPTKPATPSETEVMGSMSEIPPSHTATRQVALTDSMEDEETGRPETRPNVEPSVPLKAPTPAESTTAAPTPAAPTPADLDLVKAQPPSSRTPSRPPPSSRGKDASAPPPASDAMSEVPCLTLPQAFHSEVPEPLSADGSEAPRYSKNQVKKQSIKERLESAIQRGERPSFCSNCGAIETPTWRKIWTQEHRGVPAFHEFSDKPGFVTMIDILERDANGQPASYRMIKKNLGPHDQRGEWVESLLCNPCGIWLTKFKSHRPPDRWDKDAARLNQSRRKREVKSGNSRSRKSRTKSNEPHNPYPTSEAPFPTDAVGPGDSGSRDESGGGPLSELAHHHQGSVPAGQNDGQDQDSQRATAGALLADRSPNRSRLGSTHSRGSGTVDSPIPIEDDLGATRRLLFPSPRKDGVPKVLGEVAVNLVQTGPPQDPTKFTPVGGKGSGNAKSAVINHHHLLHHRPATPPPPPTSGGDDLEHQLFGTPPTHPSTPPPAKGAAGPFKTPTRATPSHRPITRSISRSIRSARSVPRSPSQQHSASGRQLQRTPSKTPRSAAGRGTLSLGLGLSLGSASSRRRSAARHHHHHPGGKLQAHFAIDEGEDGGAHHRHLLASGGGGSHFESPLTTTLNQLLSEANGFTSGSPSHGLVDLDLSSLPNLDSDDLERHLASAGPPLDFGNFLSTDMPVMPSSPPSVGSHHHAVASFAPFSDFGDSEL